MTTYKTVEEKLLWLRWFENYLALKEPMAAAKSADDILAAFQNRNDIPKEEE